FALLPEGLFVGLVEQRRANQGGNVLNAPGGFLDPGESHASAARRELAEETGLPATKLVPLPGRPLNPNSTFFETWGEDEGVKVFAIEVDPDALVSCDGSFRLRPGTFDASPEAQGKRSAEQIAACRFLPWAQAIELSDMFTVAAIARLLAY